MSDELKKFLSRELDELKRNKIRAGALGICFVVLLIFWLGENDSGEEISLDAPKTPPPATKDLPAKPLPVPQNIDGVKILLGADAETLNVADPFAGEEKPAPPPTPSKVVTPPIVPQPPQPVQPAPKSESREKIILTGTAVSGNVKTAMFLRGKETIFRTIGDDIGGEKILDITPDFVTLEGGVRVYLQKELS